MSIFSGEPFNDKKSDVEIKTGSKIGITIDDESMYSTNNTAIFKYESMNDNEEKDPLATPAIYYNRIENKIDKYKYNNDMNNIIKNLEKIKGEYVNNKKIKDLADMALSSVNDLKDSLDDARFAKITYDNSIRSINIILSKTANEKLKNLILNKKDNLTKEDINKIEDILEDKIIDYIEEREY